VYREIRWWISPWEKASAEKWKICMK
jgi:hypothetical protein